MQGVKELVPKMMYQVHIDTLVPQNNFYRVQSQPEKIPEIHQQKINFQSDGYANSVFFRFFVLFYCFISTSLNTGLAYFPPIYAAIFGDWKLPIKNLLPLKRLL
jgi:hypothetical protein